MKELEEFEKMLKAKGINYTLTPLNQMLGVKIDYVKHVVGQSGTGTLTLDHDSYISDAYKEAIKSDTILDLSTDLKKRTQISKLNVPMTDENRKLMHTQPEPEFDKTRYKMFRKILGKVQHCAQYTHPEITTAVSLISQRTINPSDHDLRMI